MILLQQVENVEQNVSVTLYQYADLVTLVINHALQYTTPNSPAVVELCTGS